MPHWPQNLALGGFSAPQAAQVGACGAPHLIQNLFPALVSAPQLGHFMGFLAMARPNLPYGPRAFCMLLSIGSIRPETTIHQPTFKRDHLSRNARMHNSARAIA